MYYTHNTVYYGRIYMCYNYEWLSVRIDIKYLMIITDLAMVNDVYY